MSSENVDTKVIVNNSEESKAVKIDEAESVDKLPTETTADPETNEDNDDLEAVTLDYLNDYESLLKYTLKLLEDNKKLMNENIKLKLEDQEMLVLNLKLLKENEILKTERETLLRDTMTLLEYNDTLMEAKEVLENDLLDIKKKFEMILGGLKEIESMDKQLASEDKGENPPATE